MTFIENALTSGVINLLDVSVYSINPNFEVTIRKDNKINHLKYLIDSYSERPIQGIAQDGAVFELNEEDLVISEL